MYRNVMLLWSGRLLAQLGDKCYALAVAWWLLQTSGSPAVMGWFLLASMLPGILVGFAAGAMVDRWNRKKVMVAADGVRGTVLLLLYTMASHGELAVWHVFGAGICLSLAAAFFDPAVQAVMPQLVEEKELARANGVSQTVKGISMVAGPAIGVVAVSLWGIQGVLLGNGIAYCVAGLLAIFIELRPRQREIAEKGGNILAELQESWELIRGNSQMKMVLQVVACAHIFVGGLTVALPFLAGSLPGQAAANLGYMEMMMGGGLVGMSMAVAGRSGFEISGRRLLTAMTVIGCAMGAMGGMFLAQVFWTGGYLAAMAVIGGGVAWAAITWQTLLQRLSPERVAGKVFSVSDLIGNGSLPLASACFGMAMEKTPLAAMLLLLGGGLLLVMGMLGWRLGKEESRLMPRTMYASDDGLPGGGEKGQ